MDRKDKSRRGSSTSASASSMAALAAAAAAGEGSSSGSAGEALTPNGEEDQKPAKLAAVGRASSSSPLPARRGGGAGGGGPRCQAERCNADLSDAATYNRRHKVCQTHSKAPVVLVAGLRQRFCQQCSR
jgi:hypothetical protein